MKKGRRPPTRIIHAKRGIQVNISKLIGTVNIHGPLTGKELDKVLSESLNKASKSARLLL